MCDEIIRFFQQVIHELTQVFIVCSSSKVVQVILRRRIVAFAPLLTVLGTPPSQGVDRGLSCSWLERYLEEHP